MLLVTGANGFIGSALVAELNDQRHNELLLSDFVSLDERPQLLKNKDYQRFCSPSELLTGLQSDQWPELRVIFHMGACSSTTESNEAYLKEVNTDYTKKLFEICTERNIPFIYASSGATYGDGSMGFSDQIDPHILKPLNPYGWSKLWMDQWAIEQSRKPPLWMGLRFFNVYGPNEYFKDAMSSVAFKAFQQIRQSGRLKLFRSHRADFRDGEQLRDFIYVKDIVQWMIEIFTMSNDLPSGIYNMGSGKARSWLDLAKAVFTSMGLEPKIEWIDMPESIRNQYQYFTEADMSRFNSLGLRSLAWSLENGIDDYLQKYLLKDLRVL